MIDRGSPVARRRRGFIASLDRLASIGALPTDDPDTRVLKRAVIIASLAVVLVTVVWVLIGSSMGSGLVVWTSIVFAAVVLADIVDFARRPRLGRFAAVLGVASLGIVFVGYVTLGGSVAGGSDLTWAVLAPIAAIIFYGPRRSIPWFVAFVAIVALALLIDPLIRPLGTPLPYPFSLGLIAFNVIGPGSIAYVFLRYVDGQRAAARAQSDRLLLNILPASIAERLKAGEERIAEEYAETSVLFADVADFTPLVENLPAQDVVDLLTALFTRFDELAQRHGLEKIKTIGDAYMAVAGLPAPRADHATAAVEMGLAIHRAVDEWTPGTGTRLSMRVGIASGSVIAGVIGRRKFAFDLWGDTVNVASRMQSTGSPGCIQVTEATYLLLDGRYPFVRRDQVEVKGKAPMTTYLLDSTVL
ncbi:MAG: adenylate/guanylate cyclase domain-containing protein [Chloroflexota bacterium]|nr:adenylate/guanylate cyclase domain-containing protein [Chloroflexota bacterium]